MPAMAKLKVMPRGCYSCPFMGDGIFDELACLLMDFNKQSYDIVVRDDLEKSRRKECPLEFVSR